MVEKEGYGFRVVGCGVVDPGQGVIHPGRPFVFEGVPVQTRQVIKSYVITANTIQDLIRSARANHQMMSYLPNCQLQYNSPVPMVVFCLATVLSRRQWNILCMCFPHSQITPSDTFHVD
jgi:hypothetical protein